MTLKERLDSNIHPLLNIYFTAGYPELNSMPVILDALEAGGAHMVEIGIPYSDPLSDGPTIQASNVKALNNGITLEKIFEQLDAHAGALPKIMMGYLNPVLQFGMEKFCERCEKAGISGVILPDLPMNIWLRKYKNLFDAHGLSNIFLITPESSEERIREIDRNSTTFIYAVSSSATTGTKEGILCSEDYLKRIRSMNLEHPVLVGFNIRNASDFAFAANYTRGGIIGSAFIRHIANSTNLKADILQFVTQLFNPVRS
jgi:tryptophan synthase alpha chain